LQLNVDTLSLTILFGLLLSIFCVLLEVKIGRYHHIVEQLSLSRKVPDLHQFLKTLALIRQANRSSNQLITNPFCYFDCLLLIKTFWVMVGTFYIRVFDNLIAFTK